MAIILEKNGLRAEFCEQSGALCRLVWEKGGWEICGEAERELFTLNVPLPQYPLNLARSSAQRLSSCEAAGDTLRLTWAQLDTPHAAGLPICFTAKITATDEGLCFAGTLANDSGYTVEHLAYPCIGDLRRPAGAAHFWRRHWKYGELGRAELYPRFPKEYGYWSGEYSFQRVGVPESPFVLMEDGRQGLYAGCHDADIPYSLQYYFWLKPAQADTYAQAACTPQDDGHIRPWIFFAPTHLLFCAAGAQKRLMPVLLAPYAGDWQDGVAPYRRWRAASRRPAPLPAWAAQPHAWYQVQMGSYGGGARRRYTDLPAIARSCLAQGVTVIQLTGWTTEGQDGCLPRHDPDPRMGTWQQLREAIAACEAMGVHIILYTKFNFADTRTRWFREELYRQASRDVYGDIHAFGGYGYERPAVLAGANTHRLAVMCPNCEGWQQVCSRELEKCLALGASGILYDESQHHAGMFLCFDASHGHELPGHTFAGDLKLGRRFMQTCRDAGRPDFLLAGEACYDLESECYPLAYFRIGEEGGSSAEHSPPVQRYIDPDYAYVCGVWGHNDRNTLNYILLYRYIISYETRNFRGDIDEFPQTLAYGQKIDGLRRRYAECLWYTDFLGTHGAFVQAPADVAYAVHRAKSSGRRAVALMNRADTPAVCQVEIPGAAGLLCATPEAPDAVACTGEVCLPARSAAVVMER